MTNDLPIVKSIKMIRSTKMVNGLLPDGTLIRACEVTFSYLEKQDDRIAKLKAALREIADIHPFKDPEGDVSVKSLVDLMFHINITARRALDGKDD